MLHLVCAFMLNNQFCINKKCGIALCVTIYIYGLPGRTFRPRLYASRLPRLAQMGNCAKRSPAHAVDAPVQAPFLVLPHNPSWTPINSGRGWGNHDWAGHCMCHCGQMDHFLFIRDGWLCSLCACRQRSCREMRLLCRVEDMYTELFSAE